MEIGGLYIYGCYFSPNRELEEFEVYLNRLREDMRRNRVGRIVIGGDFNAKNTRWGAPSSDVRGILMGEWCEECNVELVNEGGKPTFVRGDSGTHIDVTMCSISMIGRVTDWSVSEEENLSYHRNILYTVNLTLKKKKGVDVVGEHKGWIINKREIGKGDS